MTEITVSKKRAFLIMRNGVAFAAMVAVYGMALFLVNQAFIWFEIRGISRLIIPFATVALYGVLADFAFSGDGRLRTCLVFVSVITVGALMVLLYDPDKTFHPLLSSIPFAAVAALAARATGRYLEKKRSTGA